jgi:hypothetical protein
MIRDAMTNQQIILSGNLNNKNDYYQTLASGWKIMANPYPAYYSIKDRNLIDTDFANTTGTVYLYTTENGQRIDVSYNIANQESTPEVFNGLLAPNQAFWIASENGGGFLMRKENCTHDTNKNGLKNKLTSNKKIRIRLKNENAYDEALIIFSDDGSNNITCYDSEKINILSSNKSQIYTSKSDKKLAINSLNKSSESLEIPLILDIKEAGDYALNFKDTDVYLKDNDEIIFIPSNTTYNITCSEGIIEDRLFLLYSYNEIPTNIDSNIQNELIIFAKEKTLYINNLIANDNLLIITDISGKILFKGNIQGPSFKKSLTELNNGIFIISVTNQENHWNKKIILN